MIIHRYGLQVTLISFPALLLLCAVVVYISPTIWVVFAVMMVMKGMSYALNNPTKEILYQVRWSLLVCGGCIDVCLHFVVRCSKRQQVSNSNASPGLTHSAKEVQRLPVLWLPMRSPQVWDHWSLMVRLLE